MTPLPFPLPAALAALVLLAAVFDFRSRTVPNWLTVCGAVAGAALHVGLNGWGGLKFSLLGLGLGFLIFLPLFALRGMGGGDVKLMAAIGAMAGVSNTFVIFILTAVLGGVLAIAMLLWKGGLGRTMRNVGHILSQLGRGKAPHTGRPELDIDQSTSMKLPYAIPMALGTLLYLFGTWPRA
ncbi:MAG: prepilin peptidase [Acidobacteria bacterium]|nr:prepilin peptidase [Acidobacteriota bacterium]